MRTKRRTFLQALGTVVAGMMVGQKASAKPKEFEKVIALTNKEAVVLNKKTRRNVTDLLQTGPVTFILDIPNQEVRIKGFSRKANGDLQAELT